MKAIILAAAVTLGLSGAVIAQGADHSAMDHSAGEASEAAASASTRAFEAATETMHSAMAVELTGDANVDFVRSMIPHHQAAIDMAEIMIEYGDDPELLALAEEIIEAQETEIAEMNEWLAANGAASGATAQ